MTSDSPEQNMNAPIRTAKPLLPGERVKVKSFSEIRLTLDSDSCNEGLPFMPEMTRFCGGIFTIHQRADKTCILDHQMRRMSNAVVLNGLRCDGSSHGGCQLSCAFFWKEAWLERLIGNGNEKLSDGGRTVGNDGLKTETTDHTYFCQATELGRATCEDVQWWQLSQYQVDLRSKTFSPRGLLRELFILIRQRFLWSLVRHHQLPDNLEPPLGIEESLGLQPGELVEVKSFREILSTLDRKGKHRGLAFVLDMSVFCGRQFQVASRVDRIILETTGKLHPVRDTVTLMGGICDRHRGCARNMYHLWREVWLKRVSASRHSAPTVNQSTI